MLLYNTVRLCAQTPQNHPCRVDQAQRKCRLHSTTHGNVSGDSGLV